MASDPDEHTGTAGLSRLARLAVATAVVIVTIGACAHLMLITLYVAPENAISERYRTEIDDYVRPEFTQGWRLFAPEPLHDNLKIHARAEIRTGSGGLRTSRWINLSRADRDATLGNPLPGHARNQLYNAWNTYDNSHNSDHRAISEFGLLTEQWLKRLVLLRLDREVDVDAIERIRVRAETTEIADPAWRPDSGNSSPDPTYQVLPWWSVSTTELPGGGR